MKEFIHMSLENKICLITGANSGIGKVTALELAKMKASVILVCRNKPKGLSTQTEIKKLSSNPNVDLFITDLSSQKAIRRLVSEFKVKYNSLHILINNAGVMRPRLERSVDGIEMTLAVNHLAPFLLTNLLLDRMIASAPSRIINVNSGAHHRSGIDLDDLNIEHRKYKALDRYGESKVANLMFTYLLAERLQQQGHTNVTVNALHPGFVRTSMIKNSYGRIVGSLFAPISRIMSLSPEKGAETSIYLATSPKVENITGKYFVKERESVSSSITHNTEIQRRLWELSVQMTRLD